ncbi:MAG: pilus (MSHA type) biogenesis protein MshL, partial [Pseudomonadota bacterium]
MMFTKRLTILAACASIAACQLGPKPDSTLTSIDQAIKKARDERPSVKTPERVLQALVPPVTRVKPKQVAAPEYRFDLSVTNASAAQVYQAIASGSRYNILLPATLPGSVTVSLKDVTVKEALDVLRELYGYEYRIEGNRVMVQVASLGSRIYQVSYPAARRVGRSDTRVTSGSITATQSSGGGASASGGGGSSSQEGSQVATSTDADFWRELDLSLKAIVGTEAGRQVVVSQQTGVVVVRGFPKDLAEVDQFLRASRLSIERQVMLEAKIIEVTLKDGFESGINWAGLSGGNHRFSVGVDPNRVLIPGSIGERYGYKTGAIATTETTDGAPIMSTLGQVLANPAVSGGAGVLGMAFTSNGFNGLISFLETQGKVHVLSSPRVAAVNNQKALLRVGTDDFFITNVSTTTTSGAGGNVTTPSITVQPFFSGISLDVTPQIDEDGMVTLHIRPSVSNVSENTRVVNLGSMGSFALPLASSNINETDTVVRVQDGVIVAIGGLMQQTQSSDDSKVPGAGDVPVLGNLFSRKNHRLEKRELVFLLKPTVIKNEGQWAKDVADS